MAERPQRHAFRATRSKVWALAGGTVTVAALLAGCAAPPQTAPIPTTTSSQTAAGLLAAMGGQSGAAAPPPEATGDGAAALVTNGLNEDRSQLPDENFWMDEQAGGPHQGMQTWFYRVIHVPSAELIKVLSHWKSPKGRLLDYHHLNMIIITDLPEKLQVMQTVLDEIDNIAPQVEIEAKIIEIRRTSGLEMGFELTVDRTAGSNSALRDFSTTFQSTSFVESLGNTFQGAQAHWAAVGSVVQELGDFDYVIHALEAEGRAEILSSPRIVVHGGEQAILNAVTEVPIQVTNIQGNNVFITTTFKQVGVKLMVRPRSIGRGALQLEVKPEVSSVVSFVQGQGLTAGIAIPVIAKRDASTVVDIRDGELLVVGGLFERKTRNDRRGVPILSQLPWIGHFFGSRDEAEETTEIIFLIRPRILDAQTKARALLRVPPLPNERGSAPADGN